MCLPFWKPLYCFLSIKYDKAFLVTAHGSMGIGSSIRARWKVIGLAYNRRETFQSTLVLDYLVKMPIWWKKNRKSKLYKNKIHEGMSRNSRDSWDASINNLYCSEEWQCYTSSTGYLVSDSRKLICKSIVVKISLLWLSSQNLAKLDQKWHTVLSVVHSWCHFDEQTNTPVPFPCGLNPDLPVFLLSLNE